MEPVTEIAVDMDQEEVAYIFEKYHLISAPVVDAGGRLVGQITVDDIVGIIQEENRGGHPAPWPACPTRAATPACWASCARACPG